jgi:multidrug transporter EmrE-like cation transporter
VVFGINNIGILVLSVILGMLLFQEKLSRINKAGILICILATILLAYAG